MTSEINFEYISKKIIVPCEFKVNGIDEFIYCDDFILDTGASKTVTHYSNIDVFLSEDRMRNYPVFDIGGIDSEAKKIRFYEFPLEKIKLGTVEINNVPIYITFDDRCAVSLLGMDILEHTNLLIDNKRRNLKILKISDGNNSAYNCCYDEQVIQARNFRRNMNKL